MKWLTGGLLPFLFAVVFNILFSLVFLGAWLDGASLADSPLAIVLFGMFLAGFPILYFWLGKKHAIDKGIGLIYNNARPALHGVLNTVVSSLVLGNEFSKELDDSNAEDIQKTKDYFRNIDKKIPTELRSIFKKVPIHEAVKEVSEEMEFSKANLSQIQMRVNEKVDRQIKRNLTYSSPIWMWLLLALNILLIVMAWRTYT